MERLAVPFTCQAPAVDEDAVKRLGHEPFATVQELARRKAQTVFERNPSSIVVGSDQAAVVESDLLDKPGDALGATAQLQRLRGQEHLLLTAVAIAHSGGMIEFTDVTRLLMRNLTDDEIARYIEAEKPFDCAGSYKIENLGITLFDRIDSQDHTAITGLPLLRLSSELRKLGIAQP